MHVWLLDAEAAAAAAASCSSGGRMLGQQQQLYSSAALLTGERSRLLTCYVQDYLECVESLPHDMQRNVSVLRELDNKYQGRGPQGCLCGSSPLSDSLASGHGRSEPAWRSDTLHFYCDSLPECTEGGCCVGWARGTGRPGSRPSLPLLRSARTSVGSQGWGWGPLVSPHCRPSGCSWRGEESAILSSKDLFRRSLARCRIPSCPGEGACSRAGSRRE